MVVVSAAATAASALALQGSVFKLSVKVAGPLSAVEVAPSSPAEQSRRAGNKCTAGKLV